jgi:hypothetical protein
MTLQQMVDQGLIRPHIAEHIQKQAAAARRCVSVGQPSMEKTAGDISWKHFALATAASAAVPAVIAGVQKGGQALYLGATKSRDFNGMIEANPELKHLDRVKVQRAFNTLRRFAPEMSADPLVAGTWVKRTAEYDMIDHKSVGELINASKSLRAPGGEFSPAVGSILLASKRGPTTTQLQAEEAAKARGRAQVQPVVPPGVKAYQEQAAKIRAAKAMGYKPRGMEVSV